MLLEASASQIGEIFTSLARCAAERDAALADAKRARAERDDWAAKYDALVREVLHARPQPVYVTQPNPPYDPCAECARNGGICGNAACPKRLIISYAPPAGTCAAT